MSRRPPPVIPGLGEACDAKCPAEALVFLENKLGLTLALCGHCFDNSVADLFLAGFAVREDRRPIVREQEARR